MSKREFFGYADCKTFDYFLNRCIIVAIGNGNFKMARKRIALSVDPEYHELLTRLAEYQKKTVTSIVTDF